MKKVFLYSVVISVLFLGMWLLLPTDLELTRKVPAFFATLSMISMAFAMFLSCRFKFIEPFIGGMDRAYIWHKWFGIVGVVGASFHWLLVPGPAGNGVDPLVAEIAEESGQWAMYALLLLGSVSMVRNMPYRVWFYTHKLMGPIFLVAVYHTFFSDVPFDVASHTGVTLLLVSALGIFSWVYKTFFSKKTHRQYLVTYTDKLEGAIEVKMVAKNSPIDHKSGQFAYLDFGFDKVEHFHPFTITSSPQSNELSFIIRDLGRHTHQLQSDIMVNQEVTVDGGYGQMYAKQDPTCPQVWIAGGIGITPFLAWLKEKPTQRTHIFYVGKGNLYALLIKKVNRLIKSDNITLHYNEYQNKRLSHKDILAKIEEPIDRYQVFACGPKDMLSTLKNGLVAAGLPAVKWQNENFVMR